MSFPSRLLTAFAILAVLSTSCGSTPASPGLVVRGLTNEGLQFTASISDESGRLAGAGVVQPSATGIPLTNPVSEGIANVADSHDALFVAWVGLDCEDHPSLDIGASQGRLVVRLDRGPRVAGAACPDYPHYFAVRLEFSEPVSASTTDLEVVK